MFLYHSKLLPLFFYPLGLASVSLVVALVTLWKRPKIAAGCIGISLAILMISGNGWVSKSLVGSLEWQNIPLEKIPEAEAIVVLGGTIS